MLSRPVQVRLLLVAGTLACAGGPTDNRSDDPISVFQLAGDGQMDTVTQVLPVPLEVRAVRSSPFSSPSQTGTPAPGVVVSFSVQDPRCGHPSAASDTTDASGKAMVRWQLGTAARLCTMQVRSVDPITGADVLHATFVARALPASPASVTRVVETITARAGERVGATVRVADQHGNPIPDVSVAWTPATGSGEVIAISNIVTSEAGEVSALWQLGTSVGTQRLNAIAAGSLITTFSTTVGPGFLTRIVKVSGDNGTSYSDRPPPDPLVIRAEDRYGNPIVGASVTWEGSANITWTPRTSQTDADGRSSATWTRTTYVCGPAAVVASIGEISATFHLEVCGPLPGT